MFYFDTAIPAGAQELAAFSLAVDVMDASPTFHDVANRVNFPVDAMNATPTFNVVGMTPLWMSVSTMNCTPIFHDVKMRASGGNAWIGASVAFSTAMDVPCSVTQNGTK